MNSNVISFANSPSNFHVQMKADEELIETTLAVKSLQKGVLSSDQTRFDFWTRRLSLVRVSISVVSNTAQVL